jgi:uncharacterized protein
MIRLRETYERDQGLDMDMWKCHSERKQQPIPDEDTIVFWEGCKRHRLLIQQCDECQRYRFPPSPLCPTCLSSLATWREDGGVGEVMTFCVYYVDLAGPAWQADLPYVVVVVRLCQSGVNLLSQLRGVDVDRIYIGLSVRVVFEDMGDGITLPKFQPLGGAVRATVI